jgi:GntR family transcriptional repressor for pyruvate dehydrogenase complex
VAKGVIKRHRELLNAIRARNDEAARQVVSQNLTVLREKYLAARDAAAKAAAKR